MTTPTFTPPVTPSPGTAHEPELRLFQAEFGDGYTQAAPRGLNPVRQRLTLRFEVLTSSERDEIVAFFEARAGHQSFLYALPGEPLRAWTCQAWPTTSIAFGLWSIEAQLVQSFNVDVPA